MFRRNLALTALGLCTLALPACSDGESEQGPRSDKGEGIVPPNAPAGPPSAKDQRTVLGISKLYLGDTDRAGNKVQGAWRDFGYNLDGLISTTSSTEHCAPALNANPAVPKTDGTGGIDNSFGLNLIPLIQPASVSQDIGGDINRSIANGEFTVLFDLELGSEGTATEIPATLHAGAAFGSLVDCTATPSEPNCSPPKFDGSDVWPLSPEGDTTLPVAVPFSNSFVVDDTWVSGSKGELDMVINLGGLEFTMHIVSAVITMKITARGANGSASEGVIAGVVKTEDLINELRTVAGSISTSLCQGSTFEQIAEIIHRSSDIMSDGSNGDPSVTCDAISVGMGFDAKAVQLGDVAPRPVPPPDPCAAGT
jgi:hypothetical protein